MYLISFIKLLIGIFVPLYYFITTQHVVASTWGCGVAVNEETCIYLTHFMYNNIPMCYGANEEFLKCDHCSKVGNPSANLYTTIYSNEMKYQLCFNDAVEKRIE